MCSEFSNDRPDFQVTGSNMQKWQQIPARTREYIKQELADRCIDIERLIAATEQGDDNVCSPERKVITIKEASTIAGCHPSTITRRIKDGTLKIMKTHPSQQGGVRILLSSFLAWLKMR